MLNRENKMSSKVEEKYENKPTKSHIPKLCLATHLKEDWESLNSSYNPLRLQKSVKEHMTHN